MSHRFKKGQRVRFLRGFPYRNAADGTYEIMRQLPASSDGDNQYRVKSAREHYERTAKETELERV